MRTAYEIVKAHYDANARRDMDGMLADIAQDCRWTEMDGFPCAGTYVGPEAIVENVFAALGAVWDDYTFTLDRLLDAGSDVVAIGNYTAHNKATGKAMDVRVVHVWGVADGKIRRFEQFTDTLRVAEAMRD
ncbi:nuclear transport factor 2 family protein [Brucella sp. 2716]|uniref:nuclear transport factor 2 family protein n=1 Tax=Brucella sp. 2716 TaxID=2975052 RepID=UPI00217DD608|nr:nuclear transport factor 2 family protein [Brucella sp. 2716]UWF60476.1 nuclear transport factor 2 family protein [Brucella sp. 2716]